MNTEQNKSHKRKIIVALAAGLAIAGLVGASAASLGGVENQGLGADAEVIGSCDTNGVTVEYATSYAGAEVVHVDTTVIGDVAEACDGLDFEVQLYDASDAVIGEEAGTITLVDDPSTAANTLDSFSIDFTADDVDAELVVGIAITISGNDDD